MTILTPKLVSLTLVALILGVAGVGIFIATLLCCGIRKTNPNPQSGCALIFPLGAIFLAPAKADEWLCQAGLSAVRMQDWLAIIAVYSAICLFAGLYLGAYMTDLTMRENRKTEPEADVEK